MGWRIELAPAVVRQLRHVRAAELMALRGVILALREDRRPAGGRKLAGADLWRIRVRVDGVPWRVLYQVRRRERLVVIARGARRDEGTYRDL
jgi:mRNA-degrading endonuclease RelE of RelBE toxin-antitoxin system